MYLIYPPKGKLHEDYYIYAQTSPYERWAFDLRDDDKWGQNNKYVIGVWEGIDCTIDRGDCIIEYAKGSRQEIEAIAAGFLSDEVCEISYVDSQPTMRDAINSILEYDKANGGDGQLTCNSRIAAIQLNHDKEWCFPDEWERLVYCSPRPRLLQEIPNKNH